MISPFIPKWSVVSDNIKLKIVKESKEFGPSVTAKKYHKEVNMSYWGLYEVLKKERRREEEKLHPGLAQKKRMESKEHKLTKEEKEFLDGLKQGKVGLSETSKIVAVRVFENMLKHPQDWAYLDFFRTELLRIKNEDTQLKDAWAKEIIGRFFAGKLPPRVCPECGYSLITTSGVIKGEIIDDPTRLPAHV